MRRTYNRLEGCALCDKAAGHRRAEDEEVVCICENDACGVDAIQVMLGCTAGKGNLLFHLTGKQAFNIYERKSGRSVRLVLRKKPEGLTREQGFEYYQTREPEELLTSRRRASPSRSPRASFAPRTAPSAARTPPRAFCTCMTASCFAVTATRPTRVSTYERLQILKIF